MKTALITGVTGQDGSYLAEFLLDKGYQVYGLLPHRNRPHFENIATIMHRLRLVDGDMQDGGGLRRVIGEIQPDEIYNLASQSFVGKSWSMAEYTNDVNHIGVIRLLEAMVVGAPAARLYQASTSEIFGNAAAPQCESTPLSPRSPYGVAKAAAHLVVRNYRESHNLFACSGILFNHESERRGEHFVTQKIAKAAVSIAAGRQQHVHLGDLSPKRDWGYAPEYVQVMWKMLQQAEPDDYVIGTGESYSVEELVKEAFTVVGLQKPWQDYVITDEDLFRPADVPHLEADISKARAALKWRPQVTFKVLIRRMVARWQKELQSP